MYPPTSYPPYAVGSFYILPQPHLACLLEGAGQVSLLTVEDVFVTGLLREHCSLELVNVPYSSPGLMSDCEIDRRTMVVQLVGDLEMETVRQWVENDNSDCDQS